MTVNGKKVKISGKKGINNNNGFNLTLDKNSKLAVLKLWEFSSMNEPRRQASVLETSTGY